MNDLFNMDDIPDGTEPERRVLIVGMNYIGDTLFTTPLIRAMHKSHRRTAVDVLNGPRGTAMLENNPYIRTVISKPPAGDRAAFDALIARIVQERYDIAIAASTSFESARIPYLAKIPVRAGLRTELRSFMFTHSAPRDMRTNIILQMLDILKPLGIAHDDSRMDLFISDDEHKEALAVLAKKRIAKEHTLIVHPGATRAQKRWPVEYFVKLIRQFNDDQGFPVILIGGKEDEARNAIIAADCGRAITLDLTGQLSLRTLAAVIRTAWAFVGNDSAPLHMASALNVHTVGLFGQTDPVTYGTLHDGGYNLSMRRACHPIRRFACARITRGCGDNVCMRLVTVDMVMEKLRDIFRWA
ncbi:MAG: lipopolysaccharide heptosyltransferase II [Spirochaetes bacterium]|nr:lipopolysaccharide heptosyltransferase II [Spirochaetota bacterium]